MPGLIGKKIGMTSIFNADGNSIPCTVVEAGPCVVTQIKSSEKEKYSAVQLAFDEKKEKNCTAASLGHFKVANTTPKHKIVEIRDFAMDVKQGDVLKVDSIFKENDFVAVTGKTKGKGFQGVVKRHGFSGVGGQTHGQHNRLRAPGSMGASSFPSRVFPGKRMAGHTGMTRVTIANLEVVKIMADKNIMLIKGAVPGSNGTYLIINK